MKYKTVMLDSRYRGSDGFKYRLEFRYLGSSYYTERVRDFQTMLEWLWENYGPGCERDHYKSLLRYEGNWPASIVEAEKNGPQWAWYFDSKSDESYIYIRTNEVLSHIKLKWTT